MTAPRTIADVKADITAVTKAWDTVSAQYDAKKKALAAEVDAYIAAHQQAGAAHTAEIAAANAVKATIVPVTAAVESMASDANQFLLTQPWYQRLVAFFGRNWRWVAYASGLAFMLWVIAHLHK